MKGKSISFAQVLKKKGKASYSESVQSRFSLSQMLTEWELNPNNNYTLFLGPTLTNRSKSIAQPLISSKNDSKEAIFDSWIQRQGFANNKQNFQQQYNQYTRQEKKANAGKKIILTSRGKQSKNINPVGKTNIYTHKSPNNMKSPKAQTEMIASKEVQSERCLNDKSKSPSNLKNNDIYYQENSNYDSKSQRAINSFHLQKESITGITAPLKNMKKNEQKYNIQTAKEKDQSEGEIQGIIAATDNIHIQIGQMAHRIVLQEKKKQQIEEQQLLLSLEEKKRVSLKVGNKQKENNIEVDQTSNQEDIQRKLRQEVKKQVGNFLKTNMSKVALPTFGSKMTVISAPKPKNQLFQKDSRQTQENMAATPIAGNVGFSFSGFFDNKKSFTIINQNQIPELPISDIPVIPQIPQIQSQRNHSQANEEIYDFYEKWKQKQNNFFQKNCENAPHIQSVVYKNLNQDEKVIQFNNTLTKPQKNGNQSLQAVYNTFGKHTRDLQNKETYLILSKQRISAEKPEILITIPSNYKQNGNTQIEHQEVEQNQNELQSNIKTEVLCLSASPQQLQISDKNVLLFQNVRQFQDNKEVQLEVEQLQLNQASQNRQISQNYKSQQKQLQSQITPKQINKCISKQGEPKSKEQSENQSTNQNQRSRNQNNSENIIKQSPRQSIANFRLNKVYSSPKDNNMIQIKPQVTTSQFSTNIQQKRVQQFKIPYVTMKYDGGQYNFGDIQKKNIQQKEKCSYSKGEKQQKSFTLVNNLLGSKKFEDKALNKIQSYAYLNNFNSNSLRNEGNQVRQQQKDQFQFDF